MSASDSDLWKRLEAWGPTLFVLAGGFSLIAAVNYGVTWIVASVTFNTWIGLTVLFARVASLLGVAGLSVRLQERNRRFGGLSRGVVALALVFALALLTSALLRNLGADPPLGAVVGLGTVALSILTYSLFGLAVLRTGAHAPVVGVLLFGATAALLFGLFGRLALPLGVVGVVAEVTLVVTHIRLGYRLWTDVVREKRAAVSVEPVVE